jgi:hypothetical protein
VVKLQASCALEVARPSDAGHRAALRSFAEPRFLHQTRAQGVAAGTDDLGDALAGQLPAMTPWRVHFHVPLHAQPAAPLRSTQPVLTATLHALFGSRQALTDHVEVETHT